VQASEVIRSTALITGVTGDGSLLLPQFGLVDQTVGTEPIRSVLNLRPIKTARETGERIHQAARCQTAAYRPHRLGAVYFVTGCLCFTWVQLSMMGRDEEPQKIEGLCTYLPR
jgi:hypothetical protein